MQDANGRGTGDTGTEDTEDEQSQLAPFGLPRCLAGNQEGFTSWLLPVSVSVAHAIRDNILAFLATVQDDLGS